MLVLTNIIRYPRGTFSDFSKENNIEYFEQLIAKGATATSHLWFTNEVAGVDSAHESWIWNAEINRVRDEEIQVVRMYLAKKAS